MVWRRSKESDAAPCYTRLPPDGGDGEKAMPKGYVQKVVGGEEEGGGGGERVLVPVRLLKEPRMAALLEMAAQRFGYGQRGVLRIPCDARHFRRLLHGMSLGAP